MEDIYREYRNTMMNKGSYRPYFSSRMSYGEPRKFSKTEYLGEQRLVSEPKKKEQQTEIRPEQQAEPKTETAVEDSQKIETSQKTEIDQTEIKNESPDEKSGLPTEKTFERQTDITRKRGPSPYDKVEYYGEFF